LSCRTARAARLKEVIASQVAIPYNGIAAPS
jgi:hypothetical protein